MEGDTGREDLDQSKSEEIQGESGLVGQLMAHFNITYHRLEMIFHPTLSGRHITRIVKHPFLARTLMVEFPGDDDEEAEEEEEAILLTDEVKAVEEEAWPLLASLIENTRKRKEEHGR